MNDEVTLGGYMAKHDRAAAFEGCDGQAYSAGVLIDDEVDSEDRFGASLLFVRWSPSGDAPVGHVETGRLAVGRTPEQAEARVKGLSLFDVKEALDTAIRDAPDEW
jgi:hypothetical protein